MMTVLHGLLGLAVAGLWLNEWCKWREWHPRSLPRHRRRRTLKWRQSQRIDSEAITRAAVDLYAIRSRLDVAWMRAELRRESTRVRRLMAEELEDSR